MGQSGGSHRSQTSEGSSSENERKDGSGSETESNSSSDSGTESNRGTDSTTSTGLSAIIRVLSDSMLRTELAEMEMIKAREAARLEAEKRRLEMEVELTRMVMQTHLQATASLLVGEQKLSPAKRKRKRLEHESSSTTREMSLAFLSLLQLNLFFWNSLT